MDDTEVLNYVKATALALGLPLDAGRAQAVAGHFGRTLAMVKALDNAPLTPTDELVEIYCPMPFPAISDRHKQL